MHKPTPRKHLQSAFAIALIAFLAFSSVASGIAQRAAQPAVPDIYLDGIRDAGYTLLAIDPGGDLANPGPGGWEGTFWTDQTALYVADDGSNLYIYLDLPDYSKALSSGEIGLALDTTGDVPGSGGAADPWGNAITHAYDSVNHNVGSTPVDTANIILPDVIVRGNIPGRPNNPPDDNNGWTELRLWNGSAWTGAGANWGGIAPGGQIGTHIAYADNEGVELKISWAELGLPPGSTVNLEFFATQKSATKGAYDTVPSDDQVTNWDDATTQTNLATFEGSFIPPTSTNTFTPGPGPTSTFTPGPGPCSSAQPGDGEISTDHIYNNSTQLAWRDPHASIRKDGLA